MGPLFCERRKVLHPFVIDARPAGPRPPGLFEIAFHGPVRVPVILDNRKADLAGDPDRLDDVLDVRIPAWSVVDGIRKACDHQIGHDEPIALEVVHHVLEPAFFPRNPAAAGDHMVDAKLTDSLGRRRGLVIRTSRVARRPTQCRIQANLRRVLSLDLCAAGSCRGGSGRQRQCGRAVSGGDPPGPGSPALSESSLWYVGGPWPFLPRVPGKGY